MRTLRQAHQPASRQGQYGYAILAMLAIVAIAVSAYTFTAFHSTNPRIEQDRRTAAALALAKQALMGYAVGHINSGDVSTLRPGWLPCPDTDGDGSADSPCSPTGVTAIGRLPWRTLGLPDLRDGDGECLWYAVSGNFKNSGVSAPAVLNANSTGTITINDGTGAAITAPGSVAAVIIAPGQSLAGQDRTAAGGLPCGGNMNAAAYLDSAAGISNATGNGTSNFVAVPRSDAFNDRVAWIGTQQIFGVVNRRILGELRGATTGTLTGLMAYYAAHGSAYPWAANAGGYPVANQSSGKYPYSDPTVTSTIDLDAAALSARHSDGWYSIVAYTVQQIPPRVTLSLGDVTMPVCPNLPTGSCP